MMLYKTPTSSIVIPSALAVGVHLLLAYVWWSLTPAVTVLSAPPSAMKLLLLTSPEPFEQPVTALAPLTSISKTEATSQTDATSKIASQTQAQLITSTEKTKFQLAPESLDETAQPPKSTPQNASAKQTKSVAQPEPAKKTPVNVPSKKPSQVPSKKTSQSPTKAPSKAATQQPAQFKHNDDTLLATAGPIDNVEIASTHASLAPVANTAPAVEVLTAQSLIAAPPKYPHRAIMRNQQGLVVMRFHVSAAGKASNLQLLSSSGHRLLDQAVMRYIECGLCKAPTTAGVTIGSEQEFRFRFQLQ